MIWHIRRKAGPGSPIASAHQEPQEGYTQEQLDDTKSAELQAFLASAAGTPRDFAAEIDGLKAKLARAEAAEAVLVEKGAVTKGEIDAKLPVRGEGEIPVDLGR